jgi:hypothetical protein
MSKLAWSPTNSNECVLAHSAGDLDDRRDEDPVGLIDGAVMYELAVDLQIIKRQMLEVVEGAEPSAEVVEREPAAELGQTVGERGRAGDVGDGGGFGDLEDEPIGRYARLPQAAVRSPR